MGGLIVKTNDSDESVWTTAIEHTDIEFLRALMTCMKEYSTPEEVRVNQPLCLVGLPLAKWRGGHGGVFS